MIMVWSITSLQEKTLKVGLVAETLLLVMLADYLHRDLKSKGEQWIKLLVKKLLVKGVCPSCCGVVCCFGLLFSVVCTITLHTSNPKAEFCK